ncbi:V-type ATP synthase subunit A [Catenulispora subtropica]|uniref:V-type ATP synthase subunit A n=1 Tax=Catenulispora subtropica TaxID=450798 RepID=UPI0031E1BC4E
MSGPLVEIEPAGAAALSDLVFLGEERLPGEIVAIADGVATVQAHEYTGGLAPGAAVELSGHPLSARLGPELLGGVFDGLLRPLSGAAEWLGPRRARADAGSDRRWRFQPVAERGARVEAGARLGVVTGAGPVEHWILVPPGAAGIVEHIASASDLAADAVAAVVGGTEVRLTREWPIRRPRPGHRVDADTVLHTGQRALDLLFPLAKGTTAAVPGGFGTGKTVLLQQIAKWSDADVIVYVGCGERGNEMADVVAELSELEDPRTGGRLAERTVVIANTSNMPMMARETSVYAGVCVAEYFRDMGHDAVVIADSTSRWAEALREFASRSGALPAEEGYPADLASALAAFYERAGVFETADGGRGSVTIIGAVSPAGGDLAEPVTAHTERFVRCRWTLDRDLAYARHYPAVSWSGSFSRDLGTLAAAHAAGGDPDWAGRRARVVGLLARADRLADLVDLVGVAALPADERMAVLGGRLVREALLQQSALSENDAASSAAKTAALAEAVLAVTDRCAELAVAGVDPARVERVDFGPLVRARDQAGPLDPAPVAEARDTVLESLAALIEEESP